MSPMLWPENPVFESPAEKVVFEQLKILLGEDCALFSNLRFYDEQDGDIEVDHIALIPGYGAIIIESKGGQLSFNGQCWLQSNSKGPHKVDPHGQVLKNQYAFKIYLRNRWNLGNLKCEWLIAFPETVIGRSGDPSIPRNRILDKSEIQNVVSDAKKILSANANVRLPRDPHWVEVAYDAIRGHASQETDRQIYLQNNHEYVRQLTHERKAILDVLQSNNRIFVYGPAGSGKSWMAFDQVSRWLQQGLKVGIATYNRGIASYMERKSQELFHDYRPAFVGTFHEYMRQLAATQGDTFGINENWRSFEPQIMQAITQMPEDQKFDAWVVDEAQDFEAEWWNIIKATLKDPDQGKIAIFADPEQSVYGEHTIPIAGFARVQLKENLRNSQEIAKIVSKIVDQPLVARGPHGFEVEFVVSESVEDVLNDADDAVARMTDEEIWDLGQIALLTTKYRHPIHEDKAQDPTSYWNEFWNSDDVFYGTAKGFKGLERSVVVLAINGFHETADINDLLYVGMTRARDRLVVVGTKEVLARLMP